MESFIDNPNPFCIQFIDGYIIQAQVKYRIYVNSKMES